MSAGRIVIVTGPPGAGKSTISRRLAEASASERAIHLHTDDFYAYIRKGFVEPWRPQSRDQNAVVLEALASAAAIYAAGGYEVIVDGIIGPWFLDPWRDSAKDRGLDLRYVLLLPSEAASLERATARGAGALTDPAPVAFMWKAFADLNELDEHRLDTTDLTIEETVRAIIGGLATGRYRLA